MLKKFGLVFAAMIVAIGFGFVSCSDDDDENNSPVEYSLSQLYGVTYEGKMGGTMDVKMTIGADGSFKWDMSGNSAPANQVYNWYYTSEKTSTNKFTLSLFTDADKTTAANPASITIAINSLENLSMASGAANMQGTSEMTKVSSEQ